MVSSAIKTSEILKKNGINSTVVNARFVRPLDQALIHPLARRIKKVVTMEEGTLLGGFGAAILESFSDQNLLVPTLRIGIPDKLIDHASPQQSKESLGLTPQQMSDTISKHFGWDSSEGFVVSNSNSESI